MPRDWVDRHAVNRIEDEEKKFFYRRIAAQKKPYFMRYIYPALMKEYNRYQKNTNTNCLREFGITVSELKAMNYNDMTDRQKEFIHYYDLYLPVGVGPCVMNKICRLFEDEFDGYIRKHNATKEFDYRIMKSDVEYDQKTYYKIKRLYDDYNKRLESYKIYINHERIDRFDAQTLFYNIDDSFKEECSKICPNKKMLCNIVLDLCYQKKSTRRFAWNVSGDEIIDNLLNNNDRMITYPTLDPEGDIHYCGNTFSLEMKRLEVDEHNYIERQDVCGKDA